jgi:membrane-bound serine protease (ClpP class)
VRDKENPNLAAFKTDKDLENPNESQKWEKAAPGPVRDKGPVLSLTADEALALQVAAHKIGSRDELFRQYGVEAVSPLQPGWVDALVDVLTSEPGMVFLLACGLLCLYVEVQFPGFLIPGVISAVCFVLFFWSQWLAESAGALEVVLFLLGLVLLGVELFLIPGFGFVGLVGLLCMMLSLILATQTFVVPTTDAEVWSMAYGAGKVGLALLAFVVAAVALSRFLPRMKVFDRLRLAPNSGSAESVEADFTEEVHLRTDLVGKIGEASSPLRPAGRARIGDEYFDVVTQGEFILPGSGVEVIDVQPRRIVVRERA